MDNNISSKFITSQSLRKVTSHEGHCITHAKQLHKARNIWPLHHSDFNIKKEIKTTAPNLKISLPKTVTGHYGMFSPKYIFFKVSGTVTKQTPAYSA